MATKVRWSYRGWRSTLRVKARYWFSRWPIADLLNRSDKHCWADLVTWALDGEDLREQLGHGWACQNDAKAAGGACYCGKFASPEFRAQQMKAVD